jgi:hypothetical protein
MADSNEEILFAAFLGKKSLGEATSCSLDRGRGGGGRLGTYQTGPAWNSRTLAAATKEMSSGVVVLCGESYLEASRED